MSNFAELSGGDGDEARFLVRWRGKQEGPHSAAVIEAKLMANEIGLLHEIFHNGHWVTIRDYMSERKTALEAERQGNEERERRAKEEAEKMARERDEQLRAATLAEEKRKNDFLAAGLARQNYPGNVSAGPQLPLKAHRGGLILTFGLIGVFICGPFALAAWIMGSNDLGEMDAGIMDQSGRSNTSTGKNCGIIGTLLWIVVFVICLIAA